MRVLGDTSFTLPKNQRIPGLSSSGAEVPRDVTSPGVGPNPFTAPAGQNNGTPGTPANIPDYGSLITSDPTYSQTAANLSAQGIGDAATRDAGIRQALVQFGSVPDLSSLGLDSNSPLYQSLFGAVDQNTRNSAQDLTNAGLSTEAQLSTEHNTNLGNLLDQMAAHGTVRSGATGVGTTLENQAYAGKQFSATQSLLSYLTGLQQAFAQSQSGEQNQLSQAAQDAAGRVSTEYPATPAIPGTGTFAPGYSAPPSSNYNPVSSLNIPSLKPGAPVSGYSSGSNSNLH